MASVRAVIDLGREARAAEKLRNRQPLHRIIVEGASAAAPYAEEIAAELNVKAVEFGEIDATELRVRPNLRVLGPRLGKDLGKVRAALEAGDFESLADGGFRAAGHDLGSDEVLVERSAKEGWAVAANAGVSIALDTTLDDALVLEGRVYDAIHSVNNARKDAGLELTDRIHLLLPVSEPALLEHKDWIARETLALSVDLAADDEIHVTRV
jgi:isoleucyl-tRNA synthetase